MTLGRARCLATRFGAVLVAASLATGCASRTSSADALEHARAVLTNLAHADVPGYRAVRSLEPATTRTIDTRPGRRPSTDRQMDVAVVGPGYFEVRDAAGVPYYTRAGRLEVDANRNVCLRENGTSYVYWPLITVPASVADLIVDRDGRVTALMPNATERRPVGQFMLTRFDRRLGAVLGTVSYERNLRHVRGSLYQPAFTCVSLASTTQPTLGGESQIAQGFLERSNVNIALEALRGRLIRFQR